MLQELGPEQSLLKIINRYDYIYRKAALKLLQRQNESVQIGALRVMLEVTKALQVVTVPNLDAGTQRPSEIRIRWQTQDESQSMDYDALSEDEPAIIREAARIHIRHQKPKESTPLH